MTTLLLESLFILLLVLLNGGLAMSEMAIVSARQARLKGRADRGDRNAAAALALKAQPTEFLSTVQIGITFVGVLAGAVGGATIAEALAARLHDVRWVGPYAESISVATVVLGVGYLSLVLGELIPKRVALGRPEQVAAAVARPMQALARLMAPAVRFLTLSSDVLLKILPVSSIGEPGVSEQEIRHLIRHGTRTGILDAAEGSMLEAFSGSETAGLAC